MGGINAKAAQGVDRRLADGVAGQLGNIDGIQPVVGQRDGYIGLPAAEGGLQLVVLEEPIISIGAKRSMIRQKLQRACSWYVPPYFCTQVDSKAPKVSSR